MKTSISLPGMTMSSRKRAVRKLLGNGATPEWVAQLRPEYMIGARLRPCPGCERCLSQPVRYDQLPRGYTVMIEAGSKFYATAASGAAWPMERRSDGSWLRRGGATLTLATFQPQDLVRVVDSGPKACRGTGVLPARRSGAYGLQRPEDWDQHDFQWPWERFTAQICRRCDLSTYPGIKAIGACDSKRKERL